MKEKEKNVPGGKRFKHKLDMLGPGTVMAGLIVVFVIAGLVLFQLQLRIASYVAFGVAAAVLLALLVLLAVEGHQDKVLTEAALAEEAETEENDA